MRRIRYSRNARKCAACISDGIAAAPLHSCRGRIGADKKASYERSEEREIVTITLPSDDDNGAGNARFPVCGCTRAVASKRTDGRAHENVPAFTLRCSTNTLNLLACTFAGYVVAVN